MTKEEAIENLEGCICGYEVGNDGKPNGNVTADLKQETIDMAIKALSAEPCEDAVSRQAVLDYIDKMPSELTADGRRMIRRRTLEEYISDNLPPVQPKQRMGMWIEEEDFFGDIGYKCSICNEVFTTIEYEPNDSTMNYCPNCGAKMESEVRE